jgi:heptaprenyl diphosphate synthase
MIGDLRLQIRLSLLIAVGLTLHVFEAFLPGLPWQKPGLANLVTLLALFQFGFRAALLVATMRIILGALVLGTLFNPVFIIGLSSGLVATIVMAAVHHAAPRCFTIVGISLLGAFVHSLAQIAVAGLIVVQSFRILYLLPIMLLSSVFSGSLVGFFAHFILIKVKNLDVKGSQS